MRTHYATGAGVCAVLTSRAICRRGTWPDPPVWAVSEPSLVTCGQCRARTAFKALVSESHVAEEAPRPLQENLALSSQSRESTGANRVSVEGRGQSISDARHSDPEPDDSGSER